MQPFEIACPHCQAAILVKPVSNRTTVLCRACGNTVIWERTGKPFPLRTVVGFGLGLFVVLSAAFILLTWALFTPRISPASPNAPEGPIPGDFAPSPTVIGAEQDFEVTFPGPPRVWGDRYEFETDSYVLKAQTINIPDYGAYTTGSTARTLMNFQYYPDYEQWRVGEAPAFYCKFPDPDVGDTYGFEIRVGQRVYALSGKPKRGPEDLAPVFAEFLGSFRLLDHPDDAPERKK